MAILEDLAPSLSFIGQAGLDMKMCRSLNFHGWVESQYFLGKWEEIAEECKYKLFSETFRNVKY